MADKNTPGLPPNIFGDAALSQYGEKSFTTPVDTGSAPDYLGYSKGTDRVPVNSSVGDAFKNAGTFLTDATNTATKDIGLKLKQDVDTQVDAIHKKFGVDAVADLAASGQAPGPFKGDPDIFGTANPIAAGKVKGAPPGVAKFGDAVGGLQESYDQGMLSNTAYHGQLTALVKQVTTQYGSMWGDEIQKAVQEKTGIIPAEALRKDILSDKDAEERAKQGAGQKDQNFIRENLKYTGNLAGPISQALDRGGMNNPQYMSQVKALIYSNQGQEHTLNAARSAGAFVVGSNGQLTPDKNGQPQLRDDYTRKFENAFQSDVNQFMSMSASTGGIDNPGKISATIQKHDAQGRDTPWTPEEIERINTHGQANLATMRAQLIQKAWQPGPNGEPSFGSQAGQEQVLKSVTSALAPMQAQIDRVVNKDHGIAGTIAAANHMDEEFVRQNIYKNFPIMLRTQEGQKMLGPSLTSDALVGMKKEYGDIAKAFSGSIGSTIEAGGTPPPNNPNGTLRPITLQALIDRANGSARNDTEKYDIKAGTTEMLVHGVLNKKGDPDKANLFATALFSVDNKDYLSKNFSPELQPKFFNMLTSPAMTERIEQLSKTNPAIKGQYSQTVGNMFTGIVKQQADDIKSIADEGGYTFRYNEKNNQVEFAKTGTPGKYMNPAVEQARIATTVQPLNEALHNLHEVAKRNGTTVPDILKNGLAGTGVNMGVDFVNPQTQKESLHPARDALKRTADYISSWIVKDADRPGGKDQSTVNPR